jgi:hypothetical protein
VVTERSTCTEFCFDNSTRLIRPRLKSDRYYKFPVLGSECVNSEQICLRYEDANWQVRGLICDYDVIDSLRESVGRDGTDEGARRRY